MSCPLLLKAVCTACTAALATAVAAAPATGAPAPAPVPAPAPRATGVAGLLTDLRGLYRRAEEASKTFKATGELLAAQAAETRRLGTELAEARNALARSRADAGELARQQYRGSSDLSRYLELLLAENPRQALDREYLMERMARHRLATIARLERGELYADALATRSRKALDAQQTLAERHREQRDAVRTRLRQVEELLASLSPAELAQLAQLEGARTGGTQQLLGGSSYAPDAGRPKPSDGSGPTQPATPDSTSAVSGGQLRANGRTADVQPRTGRTGMPPPTRRTPPGIA
ncbi:hypothetical protein [Streptomyces sp. FIT100]|uniref:coiled-coil domain-containing protein n=1 Tax=Streptomyces sp. FIT100 TaxID=2837956 RepID=UPI0021C767F3|nr:hypothetical protein [Streptomyces sp. FIT100]UUN29165.1 hypothetical protein KK483_24380 [Streptomyces sp. FIT100]